jgi:hypothetical protein
VDRPGEPIHVPHHRSLDPHCRSVRSLEEIARSPDPAAARQIRPPRARIQPLTVDPASNHQISPFTVAGFERAPVASPQPDLAEPSTGSGRGDGGAALHRRHRPCFSPPHVSCAAAPARLYPTAPHRTSATGATARHVAAGLVHHRTARRADLGAGLVATTCAPPEEGRPSTTATERSEGEKRVREVRVRLSQER